MGRDTVRQTEVRTSRVPVSSNRAPLAVKGFDQTNVRGRWVNDIEDRIARFLEGGYKFVNRDNTLGDGEGSAGSSSAIDSRVRKPVGRGVYAYLMALPVELYEADQKAKQREIDLTEAAIKRPGALSPELDRARVSITRSDSERETPDFR